MTLITEISNLRQELTLTRSQVYKYEAQLGLNKKGQKKQASEAKGERQTIEPLLGKGLTMGPSKGCGKECSGLVHSHLGSCLDGFIEFATRYKDCPGGGVVVFCVLSKTCFIPLASSTGSVVLSIELVVLSQMLWETFLKVSF